MDLAVADTLAQKRELDMLVASRKGKQRSEFPLYHRTRKWMLANFTAAQNASRQKTAGMVQAIIAEAYAPCGIPLAALEKLYIEDLLLDTPEGNKYLVVRVFAHVLKVSSMQVAVPVEDENGDVEQLSIYHFGFARWPDKEVRAGMVLAVKNPYLRSVIANGGMSLCTFHPSDIVVLSQDHQLFPAKWKNVADNLAKDAAQWKADGNDALKNKNHHKANYFYGKGLCSPDLNSKTKRDLHRNKSHVELLLGQYDAAKADALASLLDKPDERSRELDSKALYRAGRAMYELSDYQGAKDMLQRHLQLSPSDKDGQRELKRTICRIKEQQDGVFDFVSMSKRIASTKSFRAEQADYLQRTEIRPTDDHGRGLFAAQSIACGDIVLCEKAFVAADKPKLDTQNFVVSPTSKHVFWGGHAETWFTAVQKIFNNPSLAGRLLDLTVTTKRIDDVYLVGASIPIVDGAPIVDVFRVMDTLENNGFGFMATPDQKQPFSNIPRPQLGAFYDCLGVWERASYANHSCLANAEKSFVGDYMVVRANKNIPKDTEITMSYIGISGRYEQSKMELQNWGFSCHCLLCVAEKQWDGTRSPILPGADSFEEAEPPVAVAERRIPDLQSRTVPASQLINQVKLYVEKIEDTYPDEFFANLPKIALVKRHGWLMKAYAMQDSMTMRDSSAVMYAQAIVRDHGFKASVETPGSKVSFDRSNIIMTTELVDAFAFMALYYKTKGNTALSRCMKKLALECYIIMNGSGVGFKGAYEL